MWTAWAKIYLIISTALRSEIISTLLFLLLLLLSLLPLLLLLFYLNELGLIITGKFLLDTAITLSLKYRFFLAEWHRLTGRAPRQCSLMGVFFAEKGGWKYVGTVLQNLMICSSACMSFCFTKPIAYQQWSHFCCGVLLELQFSLLWSPLQVYHHASLQCLCNDENWLYEALADLVEILKLPMSDFTFCMFCYSSVLFEILQVIFIALFTWIGSGFGGALQRSDQNVSP